VSVISSDASTLMAYQSNLGAGLATPRSGVDRAAQILEAYDEAPAPPAASATSASPSASASSATATPTLGTSSAAVLQAENITSPGQAQQAAQDVRDQILLQGQTAMGAQADAIGQSLFSLLL
jgi:hypothetical protein